MISPCGNISDGGFRESLTDSWTRSALFWGRVGAGQAVCSRGERGPRTPHETARGSCYVSTSPRPEWPLRRSARLSLIVMDPFLGDACVLAGRRTGTREPRGRVAAQGRDGGETDLLVRRRLGGLG